MGVKPDRGRRIGYRTWRLCRNNELEDGTEVFRLMVPLRIEDACLKCHGDPATSKTGDGKDLAGREWKTTSWEKYGVE